MNRLPRPPCSRCGATEVRIHERHRLGALRAWLLDGTSLGGQRGECARCGLGWVSVMCCRRFGRQTPFGAPWRVIQALRSERSSEPVPALYVGVLIVGTVIGIVLDLLVGVPWWAVAAAAVAATWLSFLSSAFGGAGGGRLGLEIKLALRPARAAELLDEETETVFRQARLPLLGLDENWDGERWLGGYGTTNGGTSEASLGHSRESPDRETQLVVGVRTRHRIGEPGPDIRLHLAALHLARQLGRSAPRWPPDENEPPWPDPQTWSPLTVSIDGVPVELRSLTDGDRWVAVGTVGEMVVTLEARKFPVERVSLTTVSDLEPYVTGARQRRDRIRQAHNKE